jgi:Glucodextranase, domain B
MTQDLKKILKIGSLCLFFLFIIVYGFFRSQDLIFGVKIKNVNIEDGQTFGQNPLNVTGNAKNAVNLSLNGRKVSIDKDGNFNETIALLSGYNVLSIEAVDKFGNNDTKIYKLIYKNI